MNYDVFDNIKFKDIESLFKLCEENKNNLANVKINYSRYNKFFIDNLNFLIETSMLSIKNNQIEIPKINTSFKDFLISKTLKSTQYGFYVKEYLSNFKNQGASLVFKPNKGYNSLTSSLRNFLISMNLVKYEVNTDQYILLDHKLFENLHKIKFSPDELKRQIEKQNQIGLLAEEFIYNLEKKKVSKIDQHLKPEHISKEDVSAGFDILSYQKNNNKIKKIFIEVKAVSSSNFKFYLSNGEYQISIKYKDNYYLYLLPVDHTIDGKFDEHDIVKINNLEKNLYMNKSKWIHESNGYIFYKK